MADAGNDRIQKFSSDGQFLTKWGTERCPHGVAVDSSGNVYVTSSCNSIQKFIPCTDPDSASPTPFTISDVRSRLSGRLDAASRSSAGTTSTIIQEMFRSRTDTTSSIAIPEMPETTELESYISTDVTDVTVDQQDWEERVSQFNAERTSSSRAEYIAQTVQSSSTRSEIISEARGTG